MRIGVISDTHIPERAKEIPKVILEDFKNVSLILHTGDLVILDVLKRLNDICEVIAVWGNMDCREVREILPEKKIINIKKFKIGIFHGWGAPFNLINLAEKEFQKDKCDVIVFGHSHSPFNEVRNGVLFFNPGSPTDKIFSPYNSYGILEINDEIKGKIIKL